MVRRRDAQLSFAQLLLFSATLPQPEALMDPVLRRMDLLLEDESLVDEVMVILRRHAQSSRKGRYGTPAEVVLRMLVLKHVRQWSYEALCREVAGSLVYRRFCRIDAGRVPDDKTLVKLGQLVEGPALRALFDRVVQQAVEQKVTCGAKLRLDTTVVEAPIHHPTDSRLCEDVVRVLGRSLKRLLEAGVTLSFKVRNVSRQVGRRMREITQAVRLRGKAQRKRALDKPYRRLLRVTDRLVRQAIRACQETQSQLRRFQGRAKGRIQRTLKHLERFIPRGRQVVRQTRARVLKGRTRSAGKLVSIFEPHAQILRRGKPHRPTEFGVMVKVAETEAGIVSDIAIDSDKADAPLLAPTVERHKEIFGRAPRLVATDRAFYSARGEQRLEELGVRQRVIPKPGYRSPARLAHERQRWFRRGRAWRAGGEARIGHLKHSFGMERSAYRGPGGMERTILWAGMANNLVAICRAS